MAEKLILIANPGSASRKYALYKDDSRLATVHFELDNAGQVVYGLQTQKVVVSNQPAEVSHITFSLSKLVGLLQFHGLLRQASDIAVIGIRTVAPSGNFQKHQKLTSSAIAKLKKLEHIAPLHIAATVQEIDLLKHYFGTASLVSISDSAFHKTMPDVAANYALPYKDVLKLDIQRFGYHGISLQSIVTQLRNHNLLLKRMIVCHIGSGVSVTALRQGVSHDTTMGFTPLEGVMMATRSGSVDPAAIQLLKTQLKLTSQQTEHYLNSSSGLLGVSGLSSDIRVLLDAEKAGNGHAKLALDMYVYKLQQAIGQMAAALDGVDGLVFTGTVGERSLEMRARILKGLTYLGVQFDRQLNQVAENTQPALITSSKHSVPVYVVHSDETTQMRYLLNQVI